MEKPSSRWRLGARDDTIPSSAMIWSRYKDAFGRGLEPLAAGIARTGISPSAITLLGPLIGSLICLWFVRTRAVIPFCVAILAAGMLDVLDGLVARVSGRVTKFGGYLDAVCDRYYEAIVVLTVAYVTGYWALSMVVLAGSLLVSYTKARAALEVSISNREWPDFMERGERSFIFVIGFGLSSVVPWRPLGHELFWWVLVGLAVAIHLTVVQRIFRAKSIIQERADR